MQAASQAGETQTMTRVPVLRRVWIALGVLGALLLMALLPPYLNVNRFQRRITQSISASLGRPVHLDHVTLNLLPVPGFTLERFVVSEDPAFGSEPTIRAESVRATLRVSTLWRRRIEFATISLTDPSVNLVHTADGRWNLDSILLQTSRLGSAPTEQRTVGPAARFPYFEATGARVNLKMDQEKTPVALTEADFAMWLPQPERWNFRIKARPTRTDVPVGYTGVLRLEGTVGRAATLGEIPIDLRGEWRGVPLGEMSRIVWARDGGWRGNVTVTTTAQGTVGNSRVVTQVRLADGRRADFVPAQLLSGAAECTALVTKAFHRVSEARCRVPVEGEPVALALSGTMDDARRPGSAVGRAVVGPIPAGGLVDLLHVLSARAPAGLVLGGVVSGDVAYGAGGLQGSVMLKDGSVGIGGVRESAATVGDAVVQVAEDGVTLQPVTLGLGGREPAVLEGRADRTGYSLRLSGTGTAERVLALAEAVPQFGDGLKEALPEGAAGSMRLDLVGRRSWGAPQVWQAAVAKPATPRRARRRRR